MADVLLCCSASVSVYKVCDLASKLTQAGHRVRTVLTENAAKLVSPQLFEAVTGEPAFVSEWGDARRSAMDHIDLSRFAEIVVVAPCSANLAARLSDEARDGQILVSQRVYSEVEGEFEAVSVGRLLLKGFPKPVLAYDIVAPIAGAEAAGDAIVGGAPSRR